MRGLPGAAGAEPAWPTNATGLLPAGAVGRVGGGAGAFDVVLAGAGGGVEVERGAAGGGAEEEEGLDVVGAGRVGAIVFGEPTADLEAPREPSSKTPEEAIVMAVAASIRAPAVAAT